MIFYEFVMPILMISKFVCIHKKRVEKSFIRSLRKIITKFKGIFRYVAQLLNKIRNFIKKKFICKSLFLGYGFYVNHQREKFANLID